MAKLEVACFNEQSAIIAAKEGADRIELCEDYSLGGITPQLETLQAIKKESDIPVYTMIRPRGGDFVYTEKEFEMMKSHLLQLKEAGADGFVFGILTKDQKLDLDKNKELVEMTSGLPCTFHRAFDRIEYKQEALEEIISCGFTTLLTSGGEHSAMEGLENLKLLKVQAGNRLTILVGGGVRSHNVLVFKNDFDFVHSACIRTGTQIIDVKELRNLKKKLNPNFN